MIIFEVGDKVNFVDDNNVFVGYDLSHQCCEKAGWFISDSCIVEEIPKSYDRNRFDISNFYFHVTLPITTYRNEELFDSVGCVTFTLMDTDEKVLYLHLFNAHNGYYTHGYEILINGETKEGRI